jgi:hypothetical protein
MLRDLQYAQDDHVLFFYNESHYAGALVRTDAKETYAQCICHDLVWHDKYFPPPGHREYVNQI